MNTYPNLEGGRIYHIYNRGNNSETLFRRQRDFAHFLLLCVRYLTGCFDIYAFCLMGNHFHFLVRVATDEEWRARMLLGRDSETWQAYDPSRRLADVFSSYAKSINHSAERTGSLFEKPFRRKLVDSPLQLMATVRYIHRNPANHGFVEDFRDWRWSSFHLLVDDLITPLQRAQVLSWFGGLENFVAVHAVVERGDLAGR
jgi:REP element-mobilizing transposase RayT